MPPEQIRKCQSCHHTYPRESMFIFTAPGLSLRVCRECYLKLIEKYLGYSQAELQLTNQVPTRQEDLPF